MKKFSSTMRASSRRASRNAKIKKNILIAILVISLLFLGGHVISLFSSAVYSSVIKIETWFFDSSSSLPSYFNDRSKLLKKNEELQSKLSYEAGTTKTIRRLQRENVDLRNLLGNGDESRIAANVIGQPANTPYDVIVIDRGKDYGIKKNAPVYIGVDQAIGYVAEVFSNTAVVTLATTPGFETTVYILGSDIYTTAKGIGGGILQVSVPHGVPLYVGDLVVIPSFNSGIYGRVDVVNSVPSEPEQRGYVTLEVPMQSIRFVSVGSEPLPSISFKEATKIVENTEKRLATFEVPDEILIDVNSTSTNSTEDP